MYKTREVSQNMKYWECVVFYVHLIELNERNLLKIGPGVQMLRLFKVGNFGRFSCDGKNVIFGPK